MLDELAARPGARRASLAPADEQSMLAYPWPGNVRELRHLLFIRRVLAENNGRIADSADALGISRKGLWEKMKRLDISGESREAEA